MKKEWILGLLIFSIVFSCVFTSAITASIGNSRMVLYPQVNGKTFTTIEKYILIRNVNNVTINVTLQLDSTASSFIELKDKELILKKGEEKKANFTIKVKDEGDYEGKIKVGFKPLTGNESGVGLQSTVIVFARKNQNATDIPADTDGGDSPDGDNTGNMGNVLDSVKNIPGGFVFLAISSLVLLVMLVYLIVLMKKRKSGVKLKHVNINKK